MTGPLSPRDSAATRKARVAELHDLWLRSGQSQPVMLMLLSARHPKGPVF